MDLLKRAERCTMDIYPPESEIYNLFSVQFGVSSL
jgi:hypothetical protein